ncbi:MAG: type II toxin-antitoxin system PemK/MazF family toxin [Spirochaetaceae bacterium]|nr:type II toxin-antitoxin system PemK/MazF family toxin [Spirochaetaceae bacterium]
MRPMHVATLDKRRPVLVLTRELMVGRMSTVTVAPITSTVHGIATEVRVGTRNGLEGESAVKCDQIVSIPTDQLHEHCGWLLDAQELELHEAIRAAFDLV